MPPAMAKGMAAKGMAKGKMSIQILEAQFGQAANHHYEGLLDLNTPSSQIHQSFSQLMSMRDSLLNMYGVPTQPNGGGKGAAMNGAAQWQQWGAPPAAVAAEADGSAMDW